jgi:hypothetical protein
MADEGSHQVEVVGLEDKREITVLLAISGDGEILPPQVLYAGTTARCHPAVNFPDEWDVWHTANHWSNEGRMIRFIDEIIIPYVTQKRGDMPLGKDQHVRRTYVTN